MGKSGFFTKDVTRTPLNHYTNNLWTQRHIIIIIFYFIKNIQQQCVMLHEKVKRNLSKINPLDTLLLSTTVMFKSVQILLQPNNIVPTNTKGRNVKHWKPIDINEGHRWLIDKTIGNLRVGLCTVNNNSRKKKYFTFRNARRKKITNVGSIK